METRKGVLEALKDPLYRLTRADRDLGGSHSNQWTWSYDAAGNRTSAQMDQEATTSSYNEKNQLLWTRGGGKMLWRGVLDEPGIATFNAASASINGQPARMLAGNVFEATLDLPAGANTVTIQAQDGSGNVATKVYSVNVIGVPSSYTYDANGNLTAKTEGADSWTYSWNALNQLTAVTKNALTVASYQYDPNGRRVARAEGVVSTDFTYSGLDIFRETINGTSTVRYVHGHGFDVPLTREENAGPIRYLHADALGSIARETDPIGNLLTARTYDAFGLPEQAHVSGYGFTGREYDSAAKLNYYRARYYDPVVGRFLSEDPLRFRGGVNFFAYVRGNPVNLIDPLGLKGVRPAMPVKLCPSQGDNPAWVCCDNGKFALCAPASKWPKYSSRQQACWQVHEGMHVDDYDEDHPGSCGQCSGSSCEPYRWQPPAGAPENYARHCDIWRATYLCFRRSGEQSPDGEDLEKQAYGHVADCAARNK